MPLTIILEVHSILLRLSTGLRQYTRNFKFVPIRVSSAEEQIVQIE